MDLLSFPTEIFVKILSFLSTEDILSLALVSKSLRDITHIEEIWRWQSKKDYGVVFDCRAPFSPRAFYLKILKQYGQILGLWQACIASYGGLLEVKYKDGALVGTDYHPYYRNVEKPLRAKTLFHLRLNENSDTELVCFGYNNDGPHKATISLNSDGFNYSCSDVSLHKFIVNDYEQGFLNWFLDEGLDPPHNNAIMYPYSKELLLMKIITIIRCNMSFEYKRLDWPKCNCKEPIEPGLFKGIYGAHGIELVMISFEDTNRIKAMKVTGDPNVPALEITFWVNLNFPMTLSITEQETVSQLSAVQLLEVQFDTSKPPPGPQPFRIPIGCTNRHCEIPDTCIYRFQAWGQIAGHGFENPTFSPGHFIVFSQDVFGFLWLELSTLSMYFRVKDFNKSC